MWCKFGHVTTRTTGPNETLVTHLVARPCFTGGGNADAASPADPDRWTGDGQQMRDDLVKLVKKTLSEVCGVFCVFLELDFLTHCRQTQICPAFSGVCRASALRWLVCGRHIGLCMEDWAQCTHIHCLRCD